MRNTDRYLTPAVVVTLILVVGGVVATTVCAVAWLTVQGLDPDPMLRLLAQITAAATGTATFILQIANRATVAKTERNTGVLANAVYEVADAMPRAVPRHAAGDDTVAMTAAPPVRGSV